MTSKGGKSGGSGSTPAPVRKGGGGRPDGFTKDGAREPTKYFKPGPLPEEPSQPAPSAPKQSK
jgi:hypothetical protein